MYIRAEHRGPCAALGIALIASFPWLWGISYSKGNDFFYWLHFAWFLGPDLLRGHLPDWTMLSGCGQPAFNLDHIPDAISLAFLVLIFGLEGGARAFIIICYVIGGLGIYRLAHSLVPQRQSALFAVAAYLLSWYVMRTTDFYVYTSNILQLVLLPWLVYHYRESARTGLVRPCLWAALLTAICILSNPQMAIKVVVLAAAWIVCEWSLHQRHWKALVTPVRALGCIALAAGWLAAFHIAIALIHHLCRNRHTL